MTEYVEGLTLKHTKQGEFRFSLCNQKVENYPVVFESFRIGSANKKHQTCNLKKQKTILLFLG